MPTDEAPPDVIDEVGVYASRDAADVVSTATGAASRPLLLQDPSPRKTVRDIREACRESEVIVDFAAWRKTAATAAAPTALSTGDSLFSWTMDDWAHDTLPSLAGAHALTPSRFVRTDDWAALRALVTTLAAASDPRVVKFIPTSHEMLNPTRLACFLEHLDPLRNSTVALMFAAKDRPLRSQAALRGLRGVLAAHPGAWLVGVEPLVALDAVAHGAGRAFVGTHSSLRFPSPPGIEKSSGFNAAAFVPGLLHPDLLEMRSPTVYADWYLTKPTPRCPTCHTPVDAYTTEKASKRAIQEHNLHATAAAYHALRAATPGLRPGSMLGNRHEAPAAAHQQRVDALVAHLPLMPRIATKDVDLTLHNLFVLDKASFPVPDELSVLL